MGRHGAARQEEGRRSALLRRLPRPEQPDPQEPLRPTARRRLLRSGAWRIVLQQDRPALRLLADQAERRLGAADRVPHALRPLRVHRAAHGPVQRARHVHAHDEHGAARPAGPVRAGLPRRHLHLQQHARAAPARRRGRAAAPAPAQAVPQAVQVRVDAAGGGVPRPSHRQGRPVGRPAEDRRDQAVAHAHVRHGRALVPGPGRLLPALHQRLQRHRPRAHGAHQGRGRVALDGRGEQRLRGAEAAAGDGAGARARGPQAAVRHPLRRVRLCSRRLPHAGPGRWPAARLVHLVQDEGRGDALRAARAGAAVARVRVQEVAPLLAQRQALHRADGPPVAALLQHAAAAVRAAGSMEGRAGGVRLHHPLHRGAQERDRRRAVQAAGSQGHHSAGHCTRQGRVPGLRQPRL